MIVERESMKIARKSAIIERFKVEGSGFVRAIASHIFEDVIEKNWQEFQTALSLSKGSIEDIANTHQKMLDSMMAGCMLSISMQPIATLLESIFQSILDLSKRFGHTEHELRADLADKYLAFNEKVVRFVKAVEGAERNKSGGLVTGLSLRIQINRYYPSH